jgi:protein-S-isoprenylcysteine O-methyltransferase Ste14
VKVPTVSQAVLLFFLGGVFLHFMLAGARSFYYNVAALNEPGAAIGQWAFLVGGTLPVWFLGLRQSIPPINAFFATAVLLLAVALYEWARHAIWGRRFGLGWGDHVPEELCVQGPYRLVRHPIYLAYMLAFLAALIALPHWLTASSFVANVVLFVHGARHDEHRIDSSALAAGYAAYRERTGMFLPRLN